MTDPAALGEAYRDLTEIDRRREGTRFSATLPDGMPVVALVIAGDVGARVSSHDRFAAEFQRAASVHHEAIVPPVAWGALSDGTLHCAYARQDPERLVPGSIPPAAVARIGMQIARALTMTHQSGLVHGAINSSRIVMTRAGAAQLGDFGLFSALSEGGLGPQGAATLLNDAPYSSPEVQSGGKPDEKADIYSLGAALYELLTGKPPYGGRTTTYVLASVLTDEAGESKDDIPSPVVDALLRAIERAPEDRWPSAAAFATALAAGATTGEPSAKSTKGRAGCLPGAAASAAAVLVAALLSIIAHG
jgi:serine/threonine protein kinase